MGGDNRCGPRRHRGAAPSPKQAVLLAGCEGGEKGEAHATELDADCLPGSPSCNRCFAYFTSPIGLANFASSSGTLLFTSAIWMVKRPFSLESVQRNGILTPSASR